MPHVVAIGGSDAGINILTSIRDEVIIGTGATPVIPDEVRLNPAGGIHRLHTMGDAQSSGVLGGRHRGLRPVVRLTAATGSMAGSSPIAHPTKHSLAADAFSD